MKNGLPYTRRWIWLYVLIVVLTTAATFIFVYNEISNNLMQHLPDPQASQDATHGKDISASAVKLRVFLLLTGGFFTILLLSILWLRSTIHQINRPIKKLQRAVSRLAQGQLDVTVDISSADEFGRIGAGLNELAANLQELLLYIWKQTGQCTASVEKLDFVSGEIPDDAQAQRADEIIQQLNESIENLKAMAMAYVFYDVSLEGEKALAINHPGKKAPPGAPVIEDET